MPDRGDQSLDVAPVRAGGGLVKAGWDAIGKAGSQQQDAPLSWRL
jgi:hypothetical protein